MIYGIVQKIDGTFPSSDKATLYIRYIQKQLKAVAKENDNASKNERFSD